MVASVIVDISSSEVDKVFEYSIPSGLDVKLGDRVCVPFGHGKVEGFCIAIKDAPDTSKELKEIISVLDTYSAITQEMLALMDYMRGKYYVRRVDCLRLFIPSKMRGGKVGELKRHYIELNPDIPYEDIIRSAGNKSQRSVIERLKPSGEFLSVLTSELSVSSVNTLISKGLLIKSDRQIYRRPVGIDGGNSNIRELTPSQQAAYDRISTTPYRTVLLFGVTGSGKTEVYMRCIADALANGKTAIMLVPEISLTPQTLRVFRARFGDVVAMLHSGLSDGERYDEWLRIMRGEAKVVVGARSAIFAPVKDLGIIIADEEHDSSYVSESNPRYITSDIAAFRARYNNAKVILGSATPSVDSYLLAKHGEYDLVRMDERISGEMPPIEIVNMTQEIIGGNTDIFSHRLKEELKSVVSRGEQAIIFLNRRGHSSFVMCRKCGYTAKCSDCDVTLTYHSAENVLKCHYCGKKYKMLDCCPECGSTDIKYGKVGTQRVVNELKELLPDINILRMDNETTATKTAYLDILSEFASNQAQVLVGTQMIAKGHDFPNVTLVGILDADMSLYFSDYRSSERTFQLITQVAGRAGRAVKQGKVIIQTFSPRPYVIRYITCQLYPS
ncbi:MAG: primosomal protein N', partial [Clostridia bacterium]|nr:primosomal protein N' [Clostridia bacterium]